MDLPGTLVPGPRVHTAFQPRGAVPDPSALLRSMASAFERVVKSVGLELDPNRELEPMRSLQSSASFQPYRLLSRKPSSSFFRRYTHVDLSIRDILEPDAPEPGTPGGGRGGPACPPLWACSKVPVPGGGGGRPGRPGAGSSALVSFQLSSTLGPSTSKMPWTGTWRAAWKWGPRDRGRSQAGPQCPAAPALP